MALNPKAVLPNPWIEPEWEPNVSLCCGCKLGRQMTHTLSYCGSWFVTKGGEGCLEDKHRRIRAGKKEVDCDREMTDLHPEQAVASGLTTMLANTQLPPRRGSTRFGFLVFINKLHSKVRIMCV